MKKKLICIFFTVTIFCLLNVSTLYAKEFDTFKTVQSEVYPTAADEIIYKTRVYNGRLQYRRWNATKSYWIDSDWIDM